MLHRHVCASWQVEAFPNSYPAIDGAFEACKRVEARRVKRRVKASVEMVAG